MTVAFHDAEVVAAAEIMDESFLHEIHTGVVQGTLDTGSGPRIELLHVGPEDAEREQGRTMLVDARGAEGGRPLAPFSGYGNQAGAGLDQKVLSGAFAERAVRPVAGGRRVDNVRFALSDRVVAESQAVHYPGAVVLDDDVAAVDET